jgi:hypothetical protein
MAGRFLSRKRVFIAVTLLIVFGVAMFAPLRREYTSSFDRQTGAATQLTTAHYGTPFVWLTLSKEEDAHNPEHVFSSTKDQENNKFIYDTAIWAFILALGGFISHYTDTSAQLVNEINTRRRKI